MDENEPTEWLGHPWYKVLQYGGLAVFVVGFIVEYLVDVSPGPNGIWFAAMGAGLAVAMIGAGGYLRERRGKTAAPLLAGAIFVFLVSGDSVLGYPLSSFVSAPIRAVGVFGGLSFVSIIVEVVVFAFLVVTPSYLIFRHLEPPIPAEEPPVG